MPRNWDKPDKPIHTTHHTYTNTYAWYSDNYQSIFSQNCNRTGQIKEESGSAAITTEAVFKKKKRLYCYLLVMAV